MKKYLICALSLCMAQIAAAQDLNVETGPTKIVGGNLTDPNSYPWVAQLVGSGDQPICGGSLIAPNWVLTAGHCALTLPPAKVRLNPHSSSNPQASTEVIDVQQIYVFPGFSLFGTTYTPDVCLLKLESPAISHAPIPILNQAVDLNLIEEGDWCKVLGWGSTDQQGTQSDIMKEGEMEIIGSTSCAAAYAGQFIYDQDSTICAGYLSGEPAVGAGSGDSGGPLFVLKNGNPLLIGVVSAGGNIITTADFPGIYTKVYTVRNWIQNTMNQAASFSELAQEHVQIYFDGESIIVNSKMQFSDDTILSLFDSQGKIIHVEKIALELGLKRLKTNHELADGIYFVNLYGPNFQLNQKISVFH